MEAKKKCQEQPQLTKLLGIELKKALKEVSTANGEIEYKEYMTATTMGDDMEELWKAVNTQPKKGCRPIGGVHITLADNGIMLFNQALGLPKKSRVPYQFENAVLEDAVSSTLIDEVVNSVDRLSVLRWLFGLPF